MAIDDRIREAVVRHHGGFVHATDLQIMQLWKSLLPDDQKRYLTMSVAVPGPAHQHIKRKERILDGSDRPE